MAVHLRRRRTDDQNRFILRRSRRFRGATTLLFAATLFVVMCSSASGLEDGVPVCPNRFDVTQDATTLKIPYCSNKSLSSSNEEIERLVVVVQGASRNAEGYFQSMVDAAQNAGTEDRTLIVAPHFLIDDDLSGSLRSTGLYWSSSGWKAGDPSQSDPYPRPWDISSFGVIDVLIEQISDQGLFPNLTEIVVAGHSAGAQFVNRYAAGTDIQAQTLNSGIKYRFVVANPSSYLYLSDYRPQPGRLDSFRQLTRSERRTCSNYNRYKYGTTHLNEYMSLAGASRLRQRYASREVVYLLGNQDTDRTDPLLDTTCAAIWQGPDRFTRGVAYYNYLAHLFGASIHERHVKSVVPGVGHDSGDMFDSKAGHRYLFDVDPLGPANQY